MGSFNQDRAYNLALDMVANWEFPPYLTKKYGWYEENGFIYYDIIAMKHAHKIFNEFTELELILYRRGVL